MAEGQRMTAARAAVETMMQSEQVDVIRESVAAMVCELMEAEIAELAGAEHGVVVCAVPWARHTARFTRAFEDQTAWLAVHCSKSAVAVDAGRVADRRRDLRARLR